MYAVFPVAAPFKNGPRTTGSCHCKWRNVFMNTRQNRSSTPRRKDTASGKPAGNPASWRQAFERYMALAQNLGQHDDAVTRENYYQHAEHYLRLIHDAEAAR
jgi:hypothetical protein